MIKNVCRSLFKVSVVLVGF